MGQTTLHHRLCHLLTALLQDVCGGRDALGCDLFLYWNPRDPRICLSPDAFVKLGAFEPDDLPDVWKTWERGVPELAIEVLSKSDRPERLTFEQKLDRYHELGVRELVTFDPKAPADRMLRVWDLISGDLVERVVEGERTPCVTLSSMGTGAFEWTVAPSANIKAALRLLRDGALVPTDLEAKQAAEQELADLRATLAAKDRR